MKKILLFFWLTFIMPLSVSANTINSIDIDVYLNKDGSADITEVWDVDGDDGTEWYKVIDDLGNMQLNNFRVTMDGNSLIYKEWNVDESLFEKRGYYGINYTNNGVELCFGKYDYEKHLFTLNYTLSNFVFNTEDSQIIYFNFIDKLSSVDFDNFSVNLYSYYDFPNTLDVWGYGYHGYAYVSNGRIEMSNESDMDDNYVVLLAKFPLNTFNIDNYYSQFNTFDEVYDMAKDGSFSYQKTSFMSKVINFILGILPFLITGLIAFISIKSVIYNGYGYKFNKVINKKEVPLFRDIPCNKDIYYANTLIKLNNFDYKESNILGAIILKWIRNDKVSFLNKEVGRFNKNTSVIDLTKDVVFDNELEAKLFNMMKDASKDGFLETKEFEKWCKNNYESFLGLFTRMVNDTISSLRINNHIYNRVNKDECKCKNVMDDNLYDDSIKLYGLKKYLEEFSMINTKEVMEVKIWDEYLMFAYLFGIADKVSKQLKNMYPEVITEMQKQNFDYDTLIFVNHISHRGVYAASNARSAAEAYSSGGGGFSSGGGGFGSFGGGGGGSR